MPKFDYHCPESIKEACSILKEHKQNAKILAGGTDLLVAMKQRAKKSSHLVSIKRIKALNGIQSLNGNGLKIGALTTLNTVAENETVKKSFPILSIAADSVASQQIRNMGTIGGNLCLDTRCWYFNQTQLWRNTKPLCFKTKGFVCHVIKNTEKCHALFSSDTATALTALDAKVKISNSEGALKEVSLTEFYTGVGEPVNILKDDEILTEISIPENSPEKFSSFVRLAVREGIEYPLINTAINIKIGANRVCEDARIVIGGITSSPVRALEAEKLVNGEKLSENLIDEVAKTASKEIKIIPPIFASPSYKRKMAEVCVRRGLEKTYKT